MSTEGEVLLRDKLASRTMAAVLGIPALLLPFLAVYTFIASGGVWAAMAGSLIASVVLALTALTMTVVRTVVTSREVMVRLGLWGPRVAIEDVVSVRAIKYPVVKYGGWGLKRGIDGSWAYTMLGGTDRVVEMVYRDGARERKVVFSAERPEAVAAAILKAKGAAGVRISVDDEAELEAMAEEEILAEEEQLRA